MDIPIHRFEDNGQLAGRLGERIVSDLAAAITQRGRATLAVSGGSTPRPLFSYLSRLRLDWGMVTVTQVDERWVEEDHPDSNARLIREYLLQGEAAAAHFVSMKTAAASPFGAETEVAGKLSAFADSIDVVVLGMGEDGHTASFFPGAATLGQALDPAGDALCVAVRPPHAPHDRMTLSLSALMRARHLYLHVTGVAKWEVLQAALRGGSARELPIRSVLGGDAPPLEIFYASGGNGASCLT